ncbi:hypothetical protein DBV15_11402 [Temnothorax longispinosus]|uniref:Uncharacterized protein n=1 Tax=Temnothorax longispinosus TaxID=300112 RepID=A0A4S2KUJ7_9HYME|nr:hypothetical protein DBV15_11402 [Temnothorax longispinosus]
MANSIITVRETFRVLFLKSIPTLPPAFVYVSQKLQIIATAGAATGARRKERGEEKRSRENPRPPHSAITRSVWRSLLQFCQRVANSPAENPDLINVLSSSSYKFSNDIGESLSSSSEMTTADTRLSETRPESVRMSFQIESAKHSRSTAFSTVKLLRAVDRREV